MILLLVMKHGYIIMIQKESISLRFEQVQILHNIINIVNMSIGTVGKFSPTFIVYKSSFSNLLYSEKVAIQ